MDEFDLIHRYFTRAGEDRQVIVGIGDDGAVIRPDARADLVIVADTMVAGVHFPLELPAHDIGFRALAVNLSDIAAMGARPRWMTLMLTMPAADEDWLESFSRGLFAAADEHGVVLVGGDTTRGAELVISIQLTGEVGPGAAMLRSGANPNEGIYVTGTPGDAAAGLALFERDGRDSESSQYLRQRFARPDARVAAGRIISAFASAAIDLSDGLYTDVEKLLTASGLAGNLELNAIPLSSALLDLYEPEDAVLFALGGGDDYELCFTAREADVPAAMMAAGVPLRRIGRTGPGSGLACTRDGQPFNYRHAGYRHFR